MDKVTTSSKNVTPFGGLNLIFNVISKAGLPTFLDNQIGFRNIRAEYSYSELCCLCLEIRYVKVAISLI